MILIGVFGIEEFEVFEMSRKNCKFFIVDSIVKISKNKCFFDILKRVCFVCK